MFNPGAFAIIENVFIDSAANKDMVVKKINNLRSSYRKELKKIKETKRSGASGEVYEPSLWYFHLLDFLYDQEVPRKGKNSISNARDDSEDDENEKENNEHLADSQEDNRFQETENSQSQIEETEDSQLSEHSISDTITPNSSISKKSSRSRVIKRKATETNHQNKVLKLVADKLENQNSSKYSSYGAYVGQELEALPPIMATYCQKLINDAIFETKIGSLNGQSRIVTQPQMTNINHTVRTNRVEPQQHNQDLVYMTLPETQVATASEHSQWQTPSTSN